MVDRSKIAAKIAALRAKTRTAGCTEAEAIAAAAVAARLMAEHGLSDADVEMVSAKTSERTKRATWRSRVARAVGFVTNTASLLDPTAETIEFIGRDPGPEVAAYLYEVIVNAVLREARAFKETAEYRRRRTTKTRKVALQDFATGMVVRLERRLVDMFRSTVSKDARAAATQALDRLHPNTVSMKPPKRNCRFSGAVAAGYAAGGDVTLAHGVGGADNRPIAIEGGRR